MTKFKLLGATAVVLASTLAGPVMAQQVIDNPGRCAQFYPSANCLNKGPGNPYTGNGYRHRVAYRDRAYQNTAARNDGWNNDNWNSGWHDTWNDNQWDRHDSGFWPGDVAAGVVGGAVGVAGAAVGTAGAIAAAPFHRDSYARDSYAYYDPNMQANAGYNGGWNGWYGYNGDIHTYAERNGIVCIPGTWFKGADGFRHICQ
ncbi:hypothetical protein [Bradyrhizobium sp. dw_78]|uniref:hypothetical protein n=1 Tax=Bradyrhizobium sp. dw_78 TaxID=2719793 RepID=UPI001BD639A7|nr:hypothetical protein [Bradyrhizobium sp. dw_78]